MLKTESNCLMCDKKFQHYGNRILCSRQCNTRYLSQIGWDVQDKDVNFKCLQCGGSFVYQKQGQDQPKKFCSRICFSLYHKGMTPVDHGVMFQDACCLCGKDEKVCVHHIDYDKNNCSDDNLICLCSSCHELTDHDHGFWEVFFTATMSGSPIIKKQWGAEVHIVNHEYYCLKYLIFFAGRHFSHHYHEKKRELWHCLIGEFDMMLEEGTELILIEFNKGDKAEILPNVIHQIKAKKNSIIIEVSTQSFDEDSHREKDIIPV